MLSEKRHELLSVVSLASGCLLLMSGFDTQTFIVESVLHSVHERHPNAMDNHAGYLGQAVMYGVFTIFTLLGPWICYRMGSKWTLLSGSCLFTLYLAGFFYLNSTIYYCSQALLGVGFALYYVSQGVYLSEHSTRQTISRNSVLTGAMGNSGMLLGGLLLSTIFTLNGATLKIKPTAILDANSTNHHLQQPGEIYRDYQKQEILIIYGTLFCVSLIANFLFVFLPNKQFHTCLAQTNPVVKTTLTNQIGLIWNTVCEKRIIILTPFFLFYGFSNAFWLSAYPTSFSFSRSTAANALLPAFYSISVGFGNVIAGTYIHLMSRRDPNFGLNPTMYSQIFLGISVYVMTLACTPIDATIAPTIEPALWIQPATWLCMICGMLHGAIDCCSSTMRSFICSIALPEQRMQAYSVAKLYQSLATCAGSFLSPYMNVYCWVLLLAGSQCISSLGFRYASKNVKKEERGLRLGLDKL